MEYKTPPSLAIVVESDVIGKTAVSVPCQEQGSYGQDEDQIFVAFSLKDVDEAIERLETQYLDSQDAEKAKTNPWAIDIDELRRAAARKMQGGENWDTIAARIGWVRAAAKSKDGFKPDGERVKHLLGLRPDRPDPAINYEDGLDLCKGLDLDPVDVGL